MDENIQNTQIIQEKITPQKSETQLPIKTNLNFNNKSYKVIIFGIIVLCLIIFGIIIYKQKSYINNSTNQNREAKQTVEDSAHSNKETSTMAPTIGLAIRPMPEEGKKYAYDITFKIPEGWYIEKGCLNKNPDVDRDYTCLLLNGTSISSDGQLISGGLIVIYSKPGTNSVGSEQNMMMCSGTYPKKDPQGIQEITCTESDLNAFHIYYDEIINPYFRDFQRSRIVVSQNGIIKHWITIYYNNGSRVQVLDYYHTFINDFMVNQ
jgi:hypothetical protein